MMLIGKLIDEKVKCIPSKKGLGYWMCDKPSTRIHRLTTVAAVTAVAAATRTTTPPWLYPIFSLSMIGFSPYSMMRTVRRSSACDRGIQRGNIFLCMIYRYNSELKSFAAISSPSLRRITCRLAYELVSISISISLSISLSLMHRELL